MSKITAFISLTLLLMAFVVTDDAKSTQFDSRFEGIKLLSVEIRANVSEDELRKIRENFGKEIFDKNYESDLRIISWNDSRFPRNLPGRVNYIFSVVERCSSNKQYCVFDLRTDAFRSQIGALRYTFQCDDVLFSPSRHDQNWEKIFARELVNRFKECVIRPIIKFRKRDLLYLKKDQ